MGNNITSIYQMAYHTMMKNKEVYMITISDLLYHEIVWNKELVVVEIDEIKSTIKRLEFHYDAIENNYKVNYLEPMYDKNSKKPYLILHCEK